MNEEMKAEWLNALRSGNYKQGEQKLRDYDHYCCLGVLCDLFPQGEWDGDEFIYKGEFGNAMPPYNLLAELDLAEGDAGMLSKLNDGALGEMGKPEIRPHSFPEIADWIEANL